MKRTMLFVLGIIISASLMAGGIITNTNQSAMFTRLQVRDAAIGIDATYFNPAGLVFLPNNGLYISLNNQTLGQTRTITSHNNLESYLNENEYIGDVFAPLFPGIYAAYKTGNFAFSLGFNPIGGGAGGTYETGLPSFEYSIADLVPYLQGAGQPVQGYRMDAYFDGSSAYFGYQANISYKINDKISVAVGGRYVSASESYQGHLKSVELNMGGTWMPAPTVFSGIAAEATNGAASASGAASQMQPLIDASLGGLTFAEAEAVSAIDAATRAALEGGLDALGINHADMTLEQAQSAYNAAANDLTITANKATATSGILQDQEAEYSKTAKGFTPIISVDFKVNDKLNLAFKYEHKTKLEFENDTKSDFLTGYTSTGDSITMFPDGQKSRLDIPSQFVLGATYKVIENLTLHTGFHYYLDKNADWAGKEDLLDANSWEFALGAEYQVTENFLASLGWLKTKSGASDDYQDGLSFSLPSNTIGGGFGYQLSPMLEVNLSGAYTMYDEGQKTFDHDLAGTGTLLPTKETYDKDVWVVAIGLNFNFGAGK